MGRSVAPPSTPSRASRLVVHTRCLLVYRNSSIERDRFNRSIPFASRPIGLRRPLSQRPALPPHAALALHCGATRLPLRLSTIPPYSSDWINLHELNCFVLIRSLLLHARAFALLASAWGHAANPY